MQRRVAVRLLGVGIGAAVQQEGRRLDAGPLRGGDDERRRARLRMGKVDVNPLSEDRAVDRGEVPSRGRVKDVDGRDIHGLRLGLRRVVASGGFGLLSLGVFGRGFRIGLGLGRGLRVHGLLLRLVRRVRIHCGLRTGDGVSAALARVVAEGASMMPNWGLDGFGSA